MISYGQFRDTLIFSFLPYSFKRNKLHIYLESFWNEGKKEEGKKITQTNATDH
jgi:hypothetical protein